jgi:hypothetical protein
VGRNISELLILNTYHADPPVNATSRQAVCPWCHEMKVSDYRQHGRRKWLRHKSCSEFLINAFGHQFGSSTCHLDIWKQNYWVQNQLCACLIYAFICVGYNLTLRLVAVGYTPFIVRISVEGWAKISGRRPAVLSNKPDRSIVCSFSSCREVPRLLMKTKP